MYYRFDENLNKEEYLQFLKDFPAYCISQLPEWARVKKNWQSRLCGLYRDEKLVAVSLLLIKNMPLGLKMIYAPRGPVMSFNDPEICKEFAKGLKSLARNISAIMVKIDPYVINENSKDQPQKYFGSEFDKTLNNLKNSGFRHRGFTSNANDLWQPRLNMSIPLFDEQGISLKREDIKRIVPQRKRSCINDSAKARGIYVKAYNIMKEENYKNFMHFIKQVEERQKIKLREIEYFKDIKASFGDRAVFYFGGVNLNTYLDFLRKNSEANQKKIEEASQILEKNGEYVNTCAALVIYPRDDSKLKVAEYLYAGSDLRSLRSLRTPTSVIYKIACDAVDRGCSYLNLGGIIDLKDVLFTFKSQFNPHLWEFVGEFDLIVRPVLFFALDKLQPMGRKCMRFISRIKNKNN